ncbi:MAG TPA: hypothetical protein DIT55_00495 [Spirochaetaceae bacterium]|nr:hypothetical protein [Spirochaetaceae bacterium]
MSGKSIAESLALAANADDNGWSAIAAALGLDPKLQAFENLKENWERNEEKIFEGHDDNENDDREVENDHDGQGSYLMAVKITSPDSLGEFRER